jgi:hypothetical protein
VQDGKAILRTERDNLLVRFEMLFCCSGAILPSAPQARQREQPIRCCLVSKKVLSVAARSDSARQVRFVVKKVRLRIEKRTLCSPSSEPVLVPFLALASSPTMNSLKSGTTRACDFELCVLLSGKDEVDWLFARYLEAARSRVRMVSRAIVLHRVLSVFQK